MTEEKLAGHLYDSLRNKILPLSDDLIIYPNHGAGSACGKMMSKETTDTLGNQKKVNYALQEMTKEEFIKALLEGLTTPPGYFPQNVLMNIKGYESLDSVMDRATQALDPVAFELPLTKPLPWYWIQGMLQISQKALYPTVLILDWKEVLPNGWVK